MPESFLSFDNSSVFRNNLIVQNLAPYQIQGAFSPPLGNILYEVSPLSNFSVIDSPNTLISTNQLANQLYPLNEWGPEGGFQGKYSVPGNPLPVPSNQGPYDPNDTQLDIINQYFIDTAYVENIYGPDGGYSDLVITTKLALPYQFFSPYYFQGSPVNYIPSTYTPYEILISNNPQGDLGLLSQDSQLALIGAESLKAAFEARVASEIIQLTQGSVNLDALSDPFTATQVATGKQPLFIPNWKITVPENPILGALSFANRLTTTYLPVSLIPGDYFQEPDAFNQPGQVGNALNVVNNLTGGALGPILNKYRNPSQIFLANTGNGQQSVLFQSLEYNLYRPKYDKGILVGFTSALNNLWGSGPNGDGGYYIGSSEIEPGLITSPPNQVAVDFTGKQVQTLVYGPSEIGILYEGNQGQINFGLQAPSYTDLGGIMGMFVWTSPKYQANKGFKVGKGGENIKLDEEFNIIESQYDTNLSTNIDFKPGSILDDTQRIIEAADNLQGIAKLKHAGNAISQVSKVFNDGYKEMTKGSQVIAYYDSSTGSNTIGVEGTEVGKEYCRLFQKDTPYYTYNDLQKTDGITEHGRKFNYSVFDRTYNLNIAPLRNPGSTNIINGKVKKYMFSLENLAWRTSDQPGYTYDDLPDCEKGPNGGRIMWFPPYNLAFSEDSSAQWNPTKFIGRPEPIYTYQNTSRSGSISWTIVVDTPASMNTIVEKQLSKLSPQDVNSIVDSFFAGCVKYDIYDLAKKFNQIPQNELLVYQDLVNEPRLSEEELAQILKDIPADPTINVTNVNNGGNQGGSDGNQGNQNGGDGGVGTPVITSSGVKTLDEYINKSFYFDNDFPEGYTLKGVKTSQQDFSFYYNNYIALQNTTYSTKAPVDVYIGQTKYPNKSAIPNFFTKVIIDNYTFLSTKFMQDLKSVVVDQNRKVTIELTGSASAPAKQDYNVNLSERRLDSVMKWFKKQTLGDKTIETLVTEGLITFQTIPAGEVISYPSSSTAELGTEVNCTNNITTTPTATPTSGNVENPGPAQWYSIPAMACRRVNISKITAEPYVEIVPTEEQLCKSEDYRRAHPDKCCQWYPELCREPIPPIPPKPPDETIPPVPPPPKPIPPVNIPQKIKDGISKKILRRLFSECDYFEVIKETNPMIYDTFKEKIKYFSPTFHSTTPEGLNSRLTFLNQCVRPGQTIPTIGPDGRPKFNDALNTSFGAPPVLVLRVGDFYHTKIIPNRLGIQYEPLLLDINPEGIGVQPMLAKITLGFDFIGGHGLAGPVEQLQNALSFNFYANTEIYDERSVATEDTSARDKELVGKIVPNPLKPVTPNSVPNQLPVKGQGTIGTITTSNASDDGTIETGDINYTSLINELSEKTKNYFTTVVNKLKSITEVSNFGIMEMVNLKRNYQEGTIEENANNAQELVFIYGKPFGYEANLQSLQNQVLDDIKKDDAPIILDLVDNGSFSNGSIRQVKNKLEEIVKTRQSSIISDITPQINELVSYQENYIYTFAKYDCIVQRFDGKKNENGEIVVYTLAGDPADFQKINDAYVPAIPQTFVEYNKFLSDNKVLSQEFGFNENDYGFSPPVSGPVSSDIFINRFYMIMSQIFLDPTKYTDFINSLNTEKVKEQNGMFAEIQKICDSYKKIFEEEKTNEMKTFETLEKSEGYTKYTSFVIKPVETKITYTTDKNQLGYDQNKEKLTNLYSNMNTNSDQKTFNGKVKFN